MRLVIPGFLYWIFIYSSISFADTDLLLATSISPSPAVVNGTTYLTATVSNLGTDTAQDVIVTSSLAAGLSLVSATTTKGTCSAGTPVICNIGTIDAGFISVQATVTLELITTVLGSINTTSTVTSSTPDEYSLNDSATASVVSVSLSDSADLAIAYYFQDSLAVNNIWSIFSYPGINTTYPLQVSNNGPATVTDTVVDFSLPDLTLNSFVSSLSSQGACSTALTHCVGIGCVTALGYPIHVNCDLGTLISGGTATVDIVVTADGSTGETIRGSASVSSETIADADISNNIRGSTLQIFPEPSCADQCGAGPGCFIATAAYGSDMEKEVLVLRKFRDENLLPYVWGQQFVSIYYHNSPPLAHYLKQHDFMRMIVRGLLYIPVTLIRFPWASLLALLCLLFLAIRTIKLPR